VKELTALDASLQREILREWLARSETASPLSLADDYEDFVITTVRDRPKATPSGLSREAAEAARKLPAWTFAVGALVPVAIVVLVLAHVGRSAPLASPRPLPPNIGTASTVQTTQVADQRLETPPSEPSQVAALPTPTVAPASKSPSTRAAATTVRPAATTVAVAVPVSVPVSVPVLGPEVDTELVANSDFGDRK